MKKPYKLLVSALILLVALALGGCRSSDYKTAKELMSEGKYAEAAELFGALGDYGDASDLAAECGNEIDYAAAAELFEKGDYEKAYAAYAALGSFCDAEDKAVASKREADYAEAVKKMDSGDYAEALALFEGTEGLRDAAERAQTCRREISCAEAEKLFDAGDYSGARELYEALGDFRDAAERVGACDSELAYAAAAELFEKGDYEKAYAAYAALGSFRDAEEKAAASKREVDYAEAVKKMDGGDYAEALALFEGTEGLRDAAQRAQICRREISYAEAEKLLKAGDYSGARELYEALGAFRDAAKRAAECAKELDYAAAAELFEKGDYEKAYAAFDALSSFRDAAEKAAEAKREVDYVKAVEKMESGDYAGALELLEETEGLYDTADRLETCRSEVDYADALEKMDGGDYAGALELLTSLGDFRDAAEKAEICSNETIYAEAVKLMNSGDYGAAYEKFLELCTTETVSLKELYPEEYEEFYEMFLEFGMSEEEIAEELELLFGDVSWPVDTLTGYRDSGELARQCRLEKDYADAQAAYDKKDYDTAYTKFSSLGDFRDAKTKAAECYDKTAGAKLRAAALGDDSVFDRMDAIIQLEFSDPATAAKGAYKLIGEYNGADEDWEIYGGMYLSDMLELCDEQGYADCYELFAKRALATVKFDAEKFYSPGLSTVVVTAAASERMLKNLLPALVNTGCLAGMASWDNPLYHNKMAILEDICGTYVERNSRNTLTALKTARSVIAPLYGQLVESDYYLEPRYALVDDTFHTVTARYGGTVPNFSGTTSVGSTAGKYIILSRDMNYNGSTTPSAWEIDYGMMFALEPDNIPTDPGEADFIVTIENTWTKGGMLYAGERSLQEYGVTSVMNLYTADGKLVANLGSDRAGTTVAFTSPNATSYYTPPERSRLARLLMHNWFGIYN